MSGDTGATGGGVESRVWERESHVKQQRLGGETSGRALGAVGYQSGCLPKQALRFIINTVSYEAVCTAPAAVPMRPVSGKLG